MSGAPLRSTFAVALGYLFGRYCQHLRAMASLKVVWMSKISSSQGQRQRQATPDERRTIGLPGHSSIGRTRGNIDGICKPSHCRRRRRCRSRGYAVGGHVEERMEDGGWRMRVRNKRGCPSKRARAPLMYGARCAISKSRGRHVTCRLAFVRVYRLLNYAQGFDCIVDKQI